MSTEKKKKNKAVPLIILLVCLCALVLATAIVKKANAEKESGEDTGEETITVVDRSSLTVTALSWKDEKNDVSLTYSNDSWIYDKDGHYPVDQTVVAAMAQSAAKVEAALKVDASAAGENEDYGLAQPVLTVTAAFSDGSECIYTFGSTNTFNSCQYMQVSGDDSIYMVKTTVAEAFGKSLEDIYADETYVLRADGATSDKVTSIVIETASGEVKEINDEDGISALFEKVYSLNLTDMEDYYADAENMKSAYGISETGTRVTVNYTVASASQDDDGETVSVNVPKTYKVYIGSAVPSENGDQEISGYYYSPDGSTVVYSADAETIDAILGYLSYEPAADTAED